MGWTQHLYRCRRHARDTGSTGTTGEKKSEGRLRTHWRGVSLFGMGWQRSMESWALRAAMVVGLFF